MQVAQLPPDGLGFAQRLYGLLELVLSEVRPAQKAQDVGYQLIKAQVAGQRHCLPAIIHNQILVAGAAKLDSHQAPQGASFRLPSSHFPGQLQRLLGQFFRSVRIEHTRVIGMETTLAD